MVYLRDRIRQSDESDPAQRYNIMSPIRTVITTITRKSVKMVAELDNDTAPSRILDTTDRLEDCSTVAKAATAIAVALDTKARAAQGTVVQLKSELAQYQQSRTEASRFCMRLLSSHRANSEPTPWWAEYQDDLPESRWTGSGALHSVWVCRVKSRAKSNTFDWTRTSWSPTPQT